MINCCSLIVTYNRKELLCRCIRNNLIQDTHQDILIIDNNSNDGTEMMLHKMGFLNNDRIMYLRNEYNMFGAGGFFIGLDYLFKKGYSMAWLMDDDGYPMKSDSLSKLLEAVDRIEDKAFILNSAVLYNTHAFTFIIQDGLYSIMQASKDPVNLQTKMIKNQIAPFNGTLISKECYERIGNIRRDFIIHGDEIEYRERAKKNGVFVATVIDSLFYHPRKAVESMYVWKDQVFFFKYGIPWMEFYEARNHVYVKKEYESKESLKYYIHSLKGKIACAKHNKDKYAYYISKGISAGLKGDFAPLKMHKYIEL